MEFILLGIASIYLTLRSMESLVPARAENHNYQVKKITQSTPAPIVQKNQLALLVDATQQQTMLYATFHYLKSFPQQSVTLERVSIKPEQPELFVSGSDHYFEYITNYAPLTNIPEIWTSQWHGDYVITELPTIPPVASQYVLSHKYGSIFYISEQHVVPRPQAYRIDGIDIFKWNQFIGRTHSPNNTIITEEKIVDLLA